MSPLLATVGAGVGGLALAFVASFGLVYSQTSAPSTNPADKPILSYGNN